MSFMNKFTDKLAGKLGDMMKDKDKDKSHESGHDDHSKQSNSFVQTPQSLTQPSLNRSHSTGATRRLSSAGIRP